MKPAPPGRGARGAAPAGDAGHSQRPLLSAGRSFLYKRAVDLRRLVVGVPQAAADAVSNHLVEAGLPGVQLRDETTIEATEPGRAEIVAFVRAAEVDARAAALGRYVAQLRGAGMAVDPWSWRQEPLDEVDWRTGWKASFKVTRVGRRFVVRPAWEAYDPAPTDVVLAVDPGQAFGTGTHATTRLCLRAIERVDRLWGAPEAVLDLGCGSGLLAVAAARLWPRARVQGVDVDPAAVEAARRTAEQNGVADHARFAPGSIAAASGSFDLVLANLEAKTLVDLHPEVVGRLTPRGRAVLAGLLEADAPAVVRAYAEDLRMEPEYSEDEEGWRMVVVRRHPRPA